MVREFWEYVASIPAPFELAFVEALKTGDGPPFRFCNTVLLAYTCWIDIVNEVIVGVDSTFPNLSTSVHIDIHDLCVPAHVVAPIVGEFVLLEEHKTLFSEGDISENNVKSRSKSVVFRELPMELDLSLIHI